MYNLNKRLEVPLDDRVFLVDTVASLDDLLAEVQTDDDIPFWAELWPAAQGLARFLYSKPDLEGNRILELGAGLGLPGFAAAARGAVVTQTDYSQASMAACRHNAQLNGVQTSQLVADWRHFPDLGRFDWCVASDVLYEPDFHASLIEVLQQVLRPQGRVVISDPGRENAKVFMRQLQEQGYQIERREQLEVCEGGNQKIDLYIASKLKDI